MSSNAGSAHHSEVPPTALGTRESLPAAIAYIGFGFSVLPLHARTKVPATQHGFKDATRDPERAAAWFADHNAGRNLGIRTGVESGVIVLDVDPRHAGDHSLALLEHEHGPLPTTVRARTGSNGQHVYFAHPGGSVACRTAFRPGLDLKGDGGYVVAPPSAHPDGGTYAWEINHAPGEIPLAPPPPWLMAIIFETKREQRVAARGQMAAPERLLARARSYARSVPPAAQGVRNTAAFGLAGNLLSLHDERGQGLDEASVVEVLREWNGKCTPPLPDTELAECARSAAKNGTPRPPKPPQVSPGGFGGNLPLHSSDSWPVPRSIEIELPPVPELPTNLIPARLRPWVLDVAERVQCPVGYLWASLVIALGAVIGRRVAIRPKQFDDWTVIPNLWGAIVGRPSMMKSPAAKEMFAPLRAIEHEALKKHEVAVQRYREALVIAQARKKKAKQDLGNAVEDGTDPADLAREAAAPDPAAPTPTRIILYDATVEKLGEILNENPNGVLQFRDELVGFLVSLDREGQENARPFYLQAWDGLQPYAYDRIGRGTILIKSTTVSIFGCIQPGPLASYCRAAVDGGHGDDGLLQRFQVVVWCEEPLRWRNVDRFPDGAARREASAVFDSLFELNPATRGAEPGEYETDVPYLRFDDEAQQVFNSWRERFEVGLRGEGHHEALESHFTKYRSLFPSLALIFHLADGMSGPIAAESARRAEQACGYLEQHAYRTYASVSRSETAAAKSLAAKIRARKVTSGFTLRDVYAKGWAGLSNRDMTRAAVDVLIEHGWLVEETTKGAVGAPRTFFVVNPRVFDACAGSEAAVEGTQPAKAAGESEDDWEEI